MITYAGEDIWSKENISLLLMGVQTCPVTLGINMAVSQLIGNQSTSKPSYTTLGHKLKGCSIIPQGHLLNYVQRSFIHNRQNLKAT